VEGEEVLPLLEVVVRGDQPPRSTSSTPRRSVGQQVEMREMMEETTQALGLSSLLEAALEEPMLSMAEEGQEGSAWELLPVQEEIVPLKAIMVELGAQVTELVEEVGPVDQVLFQMEEEVVVQVL